MTDKAKDGAMVFDCDAKSIEERFSILFRECYQPVCYYAFSILNDLQEAEDITDECFMRLWERRIEAPKINSMKAYLYTCVRNACYAELKRKKARTAIEIEFNHFSKGNEYPVKDGTDTELHLPDLLNALSPKRREVFRMIYREGKKIHEVASALKVSINTVKNHKRQGFSYLRKKFL